MNDAIVSINNSIYSLDTMSYTWWENKGSIKCFSLNWYGKSSNKKYREREIDLSCKDDRAWTFDKLLLKIPAYCVKWGDILPPSGGWKKTPEGDLELENAHVLEEGANGVDHLLGVWVWRQVSLQAAQPLVERHASNRWKVTQSFNDVEYF